jgi:hypothetical protein
MVSNVKGRLLSNNVDLLEEIHSELIGDQVWVLRGKGFLANVEQVLDSEYFLVRDIDGQEWRVSCFDIRSADYILPNYDTND